MADEALVMRVLPLGATLTFAVAAAWMDVRTRRIPNWLTLPFLIAGVGYWFARDGWTGLQTSLLGAAVGFGILLLLYLLGAMGGGDVKLLAGIGAWLGPIPVVMVFIVAAFVNAFYSIAVLIWRGELRRSFAALRIALHQVLAIGRHLQNDDAFENSAGDAGARGRLVPFGLMLALGVVFVILAACIVGS